MATIYATGKRKTAVAKVWEACRDAALEGACIEHECRRAVIGDDG